jgi:hypothetical protein
MGRLIDGPASDASLMAQSLVTHKTTAASSEAALGASTLFRLEDEFCLHLNQPPRHAGA